MARIPEEEVERLKREVSVERLAVAKGIALKRHGKDLVGLCPFHDDRTPSLVITPEKNLWHCLGACQAGGSVIDWVMRAEGVSFRKTAELLRADSPSLAAPFSGERHGRQKDRVARQSTTPKLPPVVETSADEQVLMKQVVDFYRATLKESPDALGYLERRGLRSAEMIERFRLGYANRTLAYRLPQKNRKAGADLRGQLQKLGVLRESGHEHFNGSLVIPIFDEEGRVTEMYGRKIGEVLRPGTPLHMYLPGPHRGVWNIEAIKASPSIILCEALIDALTFWCAGFRNVTSSYGVEGFTADHLAAFKKYGTEQVLLAYDRDEAGDKAAEKLASMLTGAGVECFRVVFPKGMDANEYARKLTPAAKSLEVVLRQAQWMGKGQAKAALAPMPVPATANDEATATDDAETNDDEGTTATVAASETTAPAANVAENASPELTVTTSGGRTIVSDADGVIVAEYDTPMAPAADAALAPSSGPGQGAGPEAPAPELFSLGAEPAAPTPSREPVPLAVDVEPEPLMEPTSKRAAPAKPDDEIVLRFGDRQWRVRGLAKNERPETMKVNVRVSREGGAFHVDMLELYSARQRTAYIAVAAVEVGVEERVIKKDLGELLSKLEELHEKKLKSGAETATNRPKLSDEEQQAALELLRDPKLLDRIVGDFERCGVVGERTNTLAGYLAATSRKLDAPLAIVIQSSSAAGKSSLMDAVLNLMPEEDRTQYSAMTGQSLFYMGEANIQHKILAIVEEEGAERASYALKLLQSEGVLTIASTGKDPATGRLVTQEYRVEGPVMIMLTTTAIEVDEELLNRCIVLSVDEGRAQTKAIHVRQRTAQTLEGILAKAEKDHLVKVHRDAQRMLRPLLVVNPFAHELTFLDYATRTRRDHTKYLTLIRTIALLHQYQRPVKVTEHRGQRLRYIEVTKSDITVANRLCHEVLGRSLDELPPQTRRLLGLIEEMVQAGCVKLGVDREDFRFSRREVRDYAKWGNTQIKLHLGRLVEMEYVLVHRGKQGQGYVYELAYDGRGKDGTPFLPGLIEVETVADVAANAGTTSTSRGFETTSRGSEGHFAGSGRPLVGPRSGGGRGADLSTEARENSSRLDRVLDDGENSHPGSTSNASDSYAKATPSAMDARTTSTSRVS